MMKNIKNMIAIPAGTTYCPAITAFAIQNSLRSHKDHMTSAAFPGKETHESILPRAFPRL